MASDSGSEEAFDDLREVGNLAMWSLSSFKSGCGIEQLRDNNTETYWQSDGPQPHILTLQFPRRMSLVQLSFYVDNRIDESYCPNRLSVSAGTAHHDLEELDLIEVEDPQGWIHLDLCDGRARILGTEKGDGRPLKANILCLSVLTNHQSGKDTHIRQVKVFAPERIVYQEESKLPPYTSTAFKMHAHIR